jgi:hypothetical protein
MKNNIFDKYKFAEGEFEKMIDQYNKKSITSRFGELNNEDNTSIINLKNISHRITLLTYEDFNYECLDTECGKILKNSSEFIQFKPRIIGETDSNGNLYNVELITIDVDVELDDDKRLEIFLERNGLTKEEYYESCQDYFDTMRSAMY